MMNLEKIENLLTITCEDKKPIWIDSIVLLFCIIFGLILANSGSKLNLSNEDLLSSWFTVSVGGTLIFTLLMTKEYRSRWIFDKNSAKFIVEYNSLSGCRRFEFILEQIQNVKIIHSNSVDAMILLPDINPPISMPDIPIHMVSEYVKTIENFLNLSDTLEGV